MSERHDIALREAAGPSPNPPTLIKELKDIIKEEFPRTAKGLHGALIKWVEGRGQQEIARAEEIEASTKDKLGRLEIERERLIKEREEVILKAEAEQTKNELAHEAEQTKSLSGKAV